MWKDPLKWKFVEICFHPQAYKKKMQKQVVVQQDKDQIQVYFTYSLVGYPIILWYLI